MSKPREAAAALFVEGELAEVDVDVGAVREVQQEPVGGAFEPVEIGAHPFDLFDARRDLLAAGGAGDGAEAS